jgi:2-methylisocitrate lyase-like PEP mutase family enzyme
MPSQADKLRALLAQDTLYVMPCCFDALSAKLIEQAGFDLTFMSGFATSASRIGQPDLGLMSYAEVLDQARNITDAIQIPLIADGDTGYGNAMNLRRTVTGFAKGGRCCRHDRRSARAKTLWPHAGQGSRLTRRSL